METEVLEAKQVHVNVAKIFEAQKANQLYIKNCTTDERKAKLKKLKSAIEAREKDILEALKKDLRKSAFESSVWELFFIYGEIDFAVKNLSKWTKPQKVSKNQTNLMTKCRVMYESKGVSLIISPWNFPFQLLMAPLISAIAAGNCCILKPSELAPSTSKVLSKLIKDTFNENEIAIVEGGVSVSSELLALPFDHIFFTGSTNVGKVVMTAAAKNLTSVTLELGGKSPTIIDEHADLKKAAAKIAWGSFANAGQTCIAPDYVFVHESQQEKFVDLLKKDIEKYFFKNGQINKEDYGKIISDSHFNRLQNLVNDAVKKGAQIKAGGTFEESDRTIHPTILTNVSLDSIIMLEEIFGPVLPVLTYKNMNEVIAFVNARNKPLALYVFSNDNQKIDNILKQTSSGGACINDVIIHYTNPHLSFGGVNTSGVGGSHGFHGFKAFSHERSVMYQSRIFDSTNIIYPPYNGKEMILKLLKKLS